MFKIDRTGAVVIVLSLACAAGATWANVRSAPAIKALTQQASTSEWEKHRQQNLAAVEKGSLLLARARTDIGAAKLSMPRDAAICLRARRMMDEKLVAAMGPGRDFAQELSDWHAENSAVDTFCAYSLHIGRH